MKNNGHDIEFDVTRRNDGTNFQIGSKIRLNNLGQIASYGESIVTNSSGKETESIDQAQITCFLYKVKMKSRGHHNLSNVFAREKNWLNKFFANKINKIRFIVWILLYGFILMYNTSSFAEHQEKSIYRLGYMKTLKSNYDETVLSRTASTLVGEIYKNNFKLYFPR